MIFHDFKIRGINLRPEAAQTIIIISSNEPPGILPAFPGFLPEIKTNRNSNPTHLMHRGPGLR